VDLRRAEGELTAVLGAWALASGVGGGLAWVAGGRGGRPGLAAFGRQTVAWGAVDGVIAAAGVTRRVRGTSAPSVDDRARRRLRGILVANAVLDVGYVATGVVLAVGAPRLERRWPARAGTLAGTGLAVVVQGSALLVLDSVFAARLAPPQPGAAAVPS